MTQTCLHTTAKQNPEEIIIWVLKPSGKLFWHLHLTFIAVSDCSACIFMWDENGYLCDTERARNQEKSMSQFCAVCLRSFTMFNNCLITTETFNWPTRWVISAWSRAEPSIWTSVSPYLPTAQGAVFPNGQHTRNPRIHRDPDHNLMIPQQPSIFPGQISCLKIAIILDQNHTGKPSSSAIFVPHLTRRRPAPRRWYWGSTDNRSSATLFVSPKKNT